MQTGEIEMNTEFFNYTGIGWWEEPDINMNTRGNLLTLK